MDQAFNDRAALPSKFPLGEVVATANVIRQIQQIEIMQALFRHARGDWGALESEDIATNERALQMGGRLFSRYFSSQNLKFYIITEWNRSQTTILLAEEY